MSEGGGGQQRSSKSKRQTRPQTQTPRAIGVGRSWHAARDVVRKHLRLVIVGALVAFLSATLGGIGTNYGDRIGKELPLPSLPKAAPQGSALQTNVIYESTADGGGTYVLQGTVAPSEVTNLNTLQQGGPGYGAWFASRGAAFPAPLDVTISVTGMSQQQTQITGIRAISRCETALKGALFLSPPSGGGPQTIPVITINLDDAGALDTYSVMQPNGSDITGTDYFRTYDVELSHGQKDDFIIQAKTDQYCMFYIEITAQTGTEKSTYTVGSRKPFRVTSIYTDDQGNVDVSRYSQLYLGGQISPSKHYNKFGESPWTEEDPKTYRYDRPYY